MRVYVASWFFPPSTSSEGIVAYKLLRNSKNTYEVCCSMSDQWGYDQKISIDADNITLHPVATDDIDIWVREAVDVFETLNASEPFDCIMTRCMPPESILVAKAIIEKHPDVKWIASFGDPISRIPIHMIQLVDKSTILTKKEKSEFKKTLNRPQLSEETEWDESEDAGVRLMCQYKRWEDYAFYRADAIIVPNGPQADYLKNGRRREGVYVIPHSYDKSLYPAPVKTKNEKIELTFIGFADKTRPVEPFIEALHRVQVDAPDLLNNIHVRLIGNIVDDSSTLVYNYYLFDTVSIEPSVSYLESLRIMQETDWLLHTDTYYPSLWKTGGSVYFAGKLADYFGTDKPILAVTGQHSPADFMITQAGGLTFDQTNLHDLATAIEQIALGIDEVEVNSTYRSRFASAKQGAKLDAVLVDMAEKDPNTFNRNYWPVCKPSCSDKLITFCIPSYNVENYLDRCLLSLVSCKNAERFEILVINDDSPDNMRPIAIAYEQKYPGIVKLVDKENGGHGSTINKALSLATGKYFKVVDGDDWLDSGELSKFTEDIIARAVDADLISTNYYQVNIETGKIIAWSTKQTFEDYKSYRFSDADFTKEYFTLASIFYKTSVLHAAHLKLQENTFFVDVEYILFPIPWVDTVAFSPRSIYRYAIGNAEQSIDKVNFVKRYDHHTRVMKSVVDFYVDHQGKVDRDKDLYIRELISRLLVTQYSLCLVYDDDFVRGCRRAKDFDTYLRAKMPRMHALMGEKYSVVALARKKRFDPRAFKHPARIDNKKQASAIQRASRSAARKVMRGGVGKVVADEVSKHQKSK